MARLRAIDSMPSVTTKEGMRMYAIRTPLIRPQRSDASSAAPMPSQIEYPAFITTPSSIPERPTIEPTDRSIPPQMMTAVIPRAITPTKAKLRVTLNRFCGLANLSLSTLKNRQASTVAAKIQKVWLATSAASALCERLLTASSSAMAMQRLPAVGRNV